MGIITDKEREMLRMNIKLEELEFLCQVMRNKGVNIIYCDDANINAYYELESLDFDIWKHGKFDSTPLTVQRNDPNIMKEYNICSKYDNMSCEIYEAIISYYKDEEYIKDILFYLYNTTVDIKLKNKISDWFEEHEWCLDCGNKLQVKSWNEWHSEIGAYEPMSELYCSNCDY